MFVRQPDNGGGWVSVKPITHWKCPGAPWEMVSVRPEGRCVSNRPATCCPGGIPPDWPSYSWHSGGCWPSSTRPPTSLRADSIRRTSSWDTPHTSDRFFYSHPLSCSWSSMRSTIPSAPTLVKFSCIAEAFTKFLHRYKIHKLCKYGLFDMH